MIHFITDPTTLPKSNLGDPLEMEKEPKAKLTHCDLCDSEPIRKAVTFCVVNQKKLCRQHK